MQLSKVAAAPQKHPAGGTGPGDTTAAGPAGRPLLIRTSLPVPSSKARSPAGLPLPPLGPGGDTERGHGAGTPPRRVPHPRAAPAVALRHGSGRGAASLQPPLPVPAARAAAPLPSPPSPPSIPSSFRPSRPQTPRPGRTGAAPLGSAVSRQRRPGTKAAARKRRARPGPARIPQSRERAPPCGRGDGSGARRLPGEG